MNRPPARQIALGLPVVMLVLAFTAIPTELRLPRGQDLARAVRVDLDRPDIPDIVVNVLGFVPVGFVLAGRGVLPAAAIATLVSFVAESSQLFSRGRSASVIDLGTNVLGAVIGLAISALWSVPPRIGISRRSAGVAVTIALLFVGIGARTSPRDLEESLSVLVANWSTPTNTRGTTMPGQLEAHWTFDKTRGNVTLDVSGNHLGGMLVNKPAFGAGIDGPGIELNGRNQYVAVGNPTALRLVGSMTISAWINSSAFPVDDAAIVSSYSGLGYQLDTTIDRGPRTVGFRLADASGSRMVRYGRTSLRLDEWYHIAGVYDAEARTLNVYLNGRLDNGCLLGSVSSRQHISGGEVFIGRRSDSRRFEFAGSIDDVRIYSKALAPGDIVADMGRTMPLPAAAMRSASGQSEVAHYDSNTQEDGTCSPLQGTDARICGLIVAFGLLVAVGCAGFWPTESYRMPCLVCSLAAGFLLFPTVAPLLPDYFRPLIPLLTFAGGASVVLSIRSTA